MFSFFENMFSFFENMFSFFEDTKQRKAGTWRQWVKKEPQRIDKLHCIRPDWLHQIKERSYYLYPTRSDEHYDALVELAEHGNDHINLKKEDEGPATRGRINDIFYTVIVGLYDEESPLHMLNGHITILEHIFQYVREWWRKHIITGGVYASTVGRLAFPKPTGIKINMMPIVMGQTASIPKEYHAYIPLLLACPIARDDWNQVGYLTIHESMVEDEGVSQRRGGIHTETPGLLRYNPSPEWEV